MTLSSVPVFARSRPSASLPSMRQRIVPSRPATGSEATYSAWSGNRPHIARSSVTSWRALKRFVSFSPEPFFMTYVPRGTPTSARKSSMTSTPFAHEPGAPFTWAPSVFTSCSATKLFEVLLSRRTISPSDSDCATWTSRAPCGTVPGRTRPANFTPRSSSSRRSVWPEVARGVVDPPPHDLLPAPLRDPALHDDPLARPRGDRRDDEPPPRPRGHRRRAHVHVEEVARRLELDARLAAAPVAGADVDRDGVPVERGRAGRREVALVPGLLVEARADAAHRRRRTRR